MCTCSFGQSDLTPLLWQETRPWPSVIPLGMVWNTVGAMPELSVTFGASQVAVTVAWFFPKTMTLSGGQVRLGGSNIWQTKHKYTYVKNHKISLCMFLIHNHCRVKTNVLGIMTISSLSYPLLPKKEQCLRKLVHNHSKPEGPLVL